MFKKYIYLALFLLSAWYFYSGIPLDVFHTHYVILTILGATLSSVLLAAAVFNFFPSKQDAEGDEKTQVESLGCFLMGIICIFFFGYSIALIFSDSDKVSRELEKNGLYTTGNIIDGSSYKTRKVDMTDVTIEYTSADGEKHAVNHEISAEQFSRYYQNQQVPLVYSKRYPAILEILGSDAAIAKYSKQPIRDLQIKDLLNAITLKTPGEINHYLNSVNQKWETGGSQGAGYVFTNEIKRIIIKVEPNRQLLYVHHTNDPGLFRRGLIAGGFKPLAADVMKGEKGTYYVSDSFLVNERMERMKTADPESMQDYELRTIVEVSKLK